MNKARLLAAILTAAALSLLYAAHAPPSRLWSPPPASADHCAVRPTVSHPTLQRGSSGDQVAVLQAALTTSGFSSGYLDGLFGSPEDAAVKAFQQSRGLPANGVVDSNTWAALDPFIDPADRHAAPQPAYGQLASSFNSAGFNRLLPGHPYFGLQAMEVGPRGARQLTSPYVPPTILKATGWIEAGWRQGDNGGAPVISFDCGYGVMQITAPGVPLSGIAWSMYGRAPEPIYSQVQVPLTTDFNVNVAMGAKTLAAKWNLSPQYRPVVGNSDPSILENWYYAVWSYNGFVSSNHPDRFNALYPLRGEYSCDLRDGFNHNRTQFAYQELVFGCVKHPPVVDGVQLWPPISVTPPPSVPPFDPSDPNYPATMDIPTPQPAHTDPTAGTLPPPVAIDAPVGTVAQPFIVSGWAVDFAAPSGTGINAIHIYAYPSDAAGTPTGAPIFLGAPALGGWRPDVATAFGNPGFASAGYSLTACGLRAGFYNLAVYAHSTLTGAWYDAHRVIQVSSSAAMALDAPLPGTVKQPFTVSGWAIDCAATSGSGVNAVHVYAYPADASGAISGPPVLAQAASYGFSRPDVAAAFGNRFANPGYALDIRGLPAGSYRLVVFAHSTVSGTWNSIHRIIRVLPPPMALDVPPEGSTVKQPFLVSGWAIDQSAAAGSGVNAVHVYAYPADASGAISGPPVLGQAATYGLSRPDVGAAFGSQFSNSGYALDIGGLPAGSYRLVVFAHSTASGTWNSIHRIIRVPPSLMALDTPPEAPTVKQPFLLSGWAIDRSAATGSGVNVVHVYAYPADASGVPTGPPVLGQAATYGLSRPDVGAAFGGQFSNSGYALDISGLPAGSYRLVVFAHSTASNAWNSMQRIIRVPPARMALEAPPEGSIQQPFLVSGWAIDQAAAVGPGVNAVHVYAYPSDASGAISGAPLLGRAATYGLSRPDVGAAFGGQFTNSGYALDVSGLPAGFYHLVVYAHSPVNGIWNQAHRIIQVP